MLASVIIPTFNRVDYLQTCLKSIVKQNIQCDQFEIIVIDNGSKDKTHEIVNQFISGYPSHTIRYFYDDVPGLLTGRHRGAKEAKRELLIFADDDIIAEEGWLSAIVDTFHRFPDVHLVGGKCLPEYETEPPSWLNYFWKVLSDGDKMMGELSLCDFGESEKEIHPASVWGLNFSIRKESLLQLGGFNPDCIPSHLQHFQGDGETGLSLKAIEKGFKAVYNPKALVYHKVPADRMTISYFDKRYFYQGICNSYTEIRKFGGIKRKHSLVKVELNSVDTIRKIYRKIVNKQDKTACLERNFEKEMLCSRFNAMEKAGFEFHQEMAKHSSKVLKWILKENYWDYSIPGYKISTDEC